MTKPCAVPTCKTGYRSDKSNRSVFRVPKDVERLRQWVAAIPGIVKLKPTHVICDKHFEDQHIIREWIKRDGSGRIIAQAPYKYPQLSKLAVPTKLLHDATNNEAVDSLAESSSHLVSSVINSVDTPHVQDVSCIQLPISEDGQSLTAMEEADTIMKTPTSDPHTEIFSAPLSKLQTQDKVFNIYSVFSERIREASTDTSGRETYSATIPKFWSVGELPAQKGQRILFSYAKPRTDSGMHFPLTQKHVVLDTDRQLQYYVNGRHVNTQGTKLKQIYNIADPMPCILETFQNMNVCSGLGDIDVQCVPANTAFQDGAQQWRHKECSMVLETKKCANCTKLRKRILQQVSRLQNRPSLHRIRDLPNPVVQRKLRVMRMKQRRERCAKNRSKLQANLFQKKNCRN